MKVLICHQEVGPVATWEDRDVLAQRDVVANSLGRLGHEFWTHGCGLDLRPLRKVCLDIRPDLVFNLVESLEGTDQLAPLVPQLLECLKIPYTGATSWGLVQWASKLATKRFLRHRGLPTPDWITVDDAIYESSAALASSSCWIIKPIWEHASVGMDDDVLVRGAPLQVQQELARRVRIGHMPLFAERFVEGREFNLSVLATNAPADPQVLPPAEIEFIDYPLDKPKIVGYRAKWDEASFEYHHTPRRFVFGAEDKPLLDQLMELATHGWRALHLRGYGRIDFRVDTDGRPFILEINANPCLAPDAGFAAALAQAGIPWDDAITRIMEASLTEVDLSSLGPIAH